MTVNLGFMKVNLKKKNQVVLMSVEVWPCIYQGSKCFKQYSFPSEQSSYGCEDAKYTLPRGICTLTFSFKNALFSIFWTKLLLQIRFFFIVLKIELPYYSQTMGFLKLSRLETPW